MKQFLIVIILIFSVSLGFSQGPSGKLQNRPENTLDSAAQAGTIIYTKELNESGGYNIKQLPYTTLRDSIKNAVNQSSVNISSDQIKDSLNTIGFLDTIQNTKIITDYLSLGAKGRLPDNLQIATAIIRRSSNSEGWIVLNDSNHEAIFIDSISESGNDVIVHYAENVSKVNTFLIVPDESFASYNLTVGASVGTSFAQISGYRDVTKQALFTKSSGGWTVSGFNESINAVITNTTSTYIEWTHDYTQAFSQYMSLGGFITSDVSTGLSFTSKQTGFWQGGSLVDPTSLPNGSRFLVQFDVKSERFNLNTIENSDANFWIIAVFERG